MKITKEQVLHVAKLARLEITDAEQEAFSRQLSAILTYMEQLNRFDTSGVQPTATVLEQTNVFREDVVRPCLPVESALANAPEQAAGFFSVPKILGDR
ncbi:MAG TPA: Asp-tRNA(Asn)/Glu-tRNA(Gln) amidotransferase subunit GatC [Nitrospiraceae bacterium]|jgi:aspartyl-tRNA(Asn)/glutamyl-tRNA(Gln) amidotransferase subunit C|nr:Asp-tRNA(Asn)/Glu-tRNA(Gln) amidotransferase subunit GatC [Nitrospiraceae bacterium]